jgi:hypothetical protein
MVSWPRKKEHQKHGASGPYFLTLKMEAIYSYEVSGCLQAKRHYNPGGRSLKICEQNFCNFCNNSVKLFQLMKFSAAYRVGTGGKAAGACC